MPPSTVLMRKGLVAAALLNLAFVSWVYVFVPVRVAAVAHLAIAILIAFVMIDGWIGRPAALKIQLRMLVLIGFMFYNAMML